MKPKHHVVFHAVLLAKERLPLSGSEACRWETAQMAQRTAWGAAQHPLEGGRFLPPTAFL